VSVEHPKTISAEEAAALVRPGDWMDCGADVSLPEPFDRALAARTSELRDMVTTPRSDVMYVVTEYGLVKRKAKAVPERAKAPIGVVHPGFREDLAREACEKKLAAAHYR
jgi:acyl-CoA hydrolase